MSNPMPTHDGVTGIEQFQEILSELTTELLDSWYEQNPHADAYELAYDGFADEFGGKYLIGRDNGADGSPDDRGFDFFYRRFRDRESWSEETEYIYEEEDGWMDADSLLNEAVFLRQIVEDAVERELLAEDAHTRFESAVDQLEADMRSFRDQYTLADIAERLRARDIDFLRRLLATDDQERRVLWQTLFSTDEDGTVIENPLDIPVQSEQHQFLFVRTDRYYYDETDGGGHYAFGVVIGYDDTPDRFFIHQLRRDDDLKDPAFEWTPQAVTQKLGFDTNLSAHSSSFPLETRVRLQGDLVMVRHDLQDERQERIDSAYAHARYDVIRGVDKSEMPDSVLESNRVHLRRGIFVNIVKSRTHELKQLQDTVGIAEETVRAKQSERDNSQLTAERRYEIVEDCIHQQVFETACAGTDQTPEEVKRAARQEVDALLTDVQQQLNAVIGNHTVIFGNARETPRGHDGLHPPDSYIVPDEGTLFVIHDEHDNKQLQLGAGVYEFQFLEEPIFPVSTETQ